MAGSSNSICPQTNPSPEQGNAGALVTRAWNSKLSKTGTHYVLTPESYNTTIAPGSSVTVGFQAAQTSTYSAPANCQLNGESCGDGPAPTASVRH
ncbi:cellulose binding domain-containing protein [Mycobacterium sp. 012931]|uniref:cellulose binding domain-containing protein n=1 Tax=Mycobacterium sp. 012931 TaxID=1187065 RepID=UPI0003F4DF4A|nr:cellulose binding domain-containing protein [Mycobacterium sp. 012931]